LGAAMIDIDLGSEGGAIVVPPHLEPPEPGTKAHTICQLNYEGSQRVLIMSRARDRQTWANMVRKWSTIPRPIVGLVANSRRGIPPSMACHFTIVSPELTRTKPISAAIQTQEYDARILAFGSNTSIRIKIGLGKGFLTYEEEWRAT
jgi:hypothetical protein